MTTINMLEHQKIVLEHLVSDENMFRKELTKSLRWLNLEEQQKLYLWLRNNFWDIYSKLIEAVFIKETPDQFIINIV
jgi:hypothetical protein